MELLSEESAEIIWINDLTSSAKKNTLVEKNKFNRVFYLKCYYCTLLHPKLFYLFRKIELDNLKDSLYYSIDIIKDVCEKKLENNYTKYLSPEHHKIIIGEIIITYKLYGIPLPDIIKKNLNTENSIYSNVYNQIFNDLSISDLITSINKGPYRNNIFEYDYKSSYFLQIYLKLKTGGEYSTEELNKIHLNQLTSMFNNFDYLNENLDITECYRWLEPDLLYFLTYLKIYCDYTAFGLTFFSATTTQYFLYLKRESVDKEMKLENVSKIFIKGIQNIFPSFIRISKIENNDLLLKQYLLATLMFSRVMETDLSSILINLSEKNIQISALFKEIQNNYNNIFKKTVYDEIMFNYNNLKGDDEILTKQHIKKYIEILKNIRILTSATWLNTRYIKENNDKNPFLSENIQEISFDNYMNFFKLTHFIEIEKKIVLFKNNVKCYGKNNGVLDAFVLTDINNSDFLWRNMDNTVYEKNKVSRLINVKPGTYTLTVIDKDNNIIMESIQISQPDAPLNITYTKKNLSCNNVADGIITYEIMGGTPPYKVYLNGNIITQKILKNLDIGLYKILVKDLNGCTKKIEIKIAKPEISLDYIINFKHSLQNKQNGFVDVKWSGGEPPYSIQWAHSNNAGNKWKIDNLAPGLYTFIMQDGTGCKKAGKINIKSLNYELKGSVFSNDNNVKINNVNAGEDDLSTDDEIFNSTVQPSAPGVYEDIKKYSLSKQLLFILENYQIDYHPPTYLFSIFKFIGFIVMYRLTHICVKIFHIFDDYY